MPDKVDVIDRMEIFCENFEGMGCEFNSACGEIFDLAVGLMRCAIALLKEQEAKPVIVTTNAYGTRFYHCPKCNRDLYAYPRQLYCSNCGQAVKWND